MTRRCIWDLCPLHTASICVTPHRTCHIGRRIPPSLFGDWHLVLCIFSSRFRDSILPVLGPRLHWHWLSHISRARKLNGQRLCHHICWWGSFWWLLLLLLYGFPTEFTAVSLSRTSYTQFGIYVLDMEPI